MGNPITFHDDIVLFFRPPCRYLELRFVNCFQLKKLYKWRNWMLSVPCYAYFKYVWRRGRSTLSIALVWYLKRQRGFSRSTKLLFKAQCYLWCQQFPQIYDAQFIPDDSWKCNESFQLYFTNTLIFLWIFLVSFIVRLCFLTSPQTRTLQALNPIHPPHRTSNWSCQLRLKLLKSTDCPILTFCSISIPTSFVF